MPQTKEKEYQLREGHPATVLALDEVRRERERQDAKWGVQRYPSVDPTLIHLPSDERLAAIAERYGIPMEDMAKQMLEEASKDGRFSWGDVFVEEVAEAFACAGDEQQMRQELVQCAAVLVAWIEDIDRRSASSVG